MRGTAFPHAMGKANLLGLQSTRILRHEVGMVLPRYNITDMR